MLVNIMSPAGLLVTPFYTFVTCTDESYSQSDIHTRLIQPTLLLIRMTIVGHRTPKFVKLTQFLRALVMRRMFSTLGHAM